ncbi:thermonuclease family protein [Rhizobiaceae bacterium]|nr:thermonuclease family protein [Rhizobiaceae bacterium]
MLLTPPALAAGPDCGLYEYKAEVVSAYDGDTIRANVDLGFNTWRMNEPFRLHGIDTPELRGVDDVTKARGLAARDALRKRIVGKEVRLCSIKDETGKYGRYLAVIWDDDGNVNEWLMSEGFAVPYE